MSFPVIYKRVLPNETGHPDEWLLSPYYGQRTLRSLRSAMAESRRGRPKAPRRAEERRVPASNRCSAPCRYDIVAALACCQDTTACRDHPPDGGSRVMTDVEPLGANRTLSCQPSYFGPPPPAPVQAYAPDFALPLILRTLTAIIRPPLRPCRAPRSPTTPSIAPPLHSRTFRR